MKLLSFVIILLLVTSSVPLGFSNTIPQIDSPLDDESSIQSFTETRKTISITLDESIGLSSYPPIKQEIENILSEQFGWDKREVSEFAEWVVDNH